MSIHPYNLRSRASLSSFSPRSSKSPRKVVASTLQLKYVIGTTTVTPGGLSCCEASNSFAYAAGSVTVLATFNAQDDISYRYFKARPTAIPINPKVSHYDSSPHSLTPTHRRTTFNSSKGPDDIGRSAQPRDWSEDGLNQTWSSRERIKAVTCVSISPNGRMLAVGETGYNPRVLLFSTTSDVVTDTPLTVIMEHTIGVRSVAFSPTSRFLATLGDVNDGFLFIWEVNPKTGAVRLLSSNKCTTNVCDMIWCGDSVVTVGTRHIKIWQAGETGNRTSTRRTKLRHDFGSPASGPAPLQGRNCLLGSLVDATFTAAVATSCDKAIITTDDGQLCLLDLGGSRADLTVLEKTNSEISAISYMSDSARLVWAGGGNSIHSRCLISSNTLTPYHESEPCVDELKSSRRQGRPSILRQSLGLTPPRRASVIALECINNRTVIVDTEATIRVQNIGSKDIEGAPHTWSAHGGAVKGIQSLPEGCALGAFFTWAKDGDIRFWDAAGRLNFQGRVEMDEDLENNEVLGNELKAAQYLPFCNRIVTGDILGVLRSTDLSWNCQKSVRAHGNEICSITYHESDYLVATGGRDRMVQLFTTRDDEIQLLQTFDDHISAVSQVLLSSDSNRLLSCSVDRTIIVRERTERKTQQKVEIAFLPLRTICFKTAPLAMALMFNSSNNLIVSTADRHIMKVDIATGLTTYSFKCSDSDSEDTVSLNSIKLSETKTPDGACILAGYSSIDKSIRLYDLDRGVLLGRDFGHTEGIGDLVFIQEATTKESLKLVSTGLDGTIMMWSAQNVGILNLSPQHEFDQTRAFDIDPEKSRPRASPASLPPLRRILSRTEIVDFSRQASPARDVSPLGLHRKDSQAAPGKLVDGNDISVTCNSTVMSKETDSEQKPPAKADTTIIRPTKQRSQPDLRSNRINKPSVQPGTVSSAVVNTPTTLANNGRLRKPPSIPNDLRSQAAVQGRRQSWSINQDSNGFKLATDQVSRVLKTYRKKLLTEKGMADLTEIESELETVLELVRNRSPRPNRDTQESLESLVEAGNDKVNMLSTLLEKASIS